MPTTLGGHSRAETVSALALQDAGLKGSFHSLVPDKQKKREYIRRTGLLRDVPLPEKRWAILCKSAHQFNLMRGIFIPLDVSVPPQITARWGAVIVARHVLKNAITAGI